jgi:hypothetical protein
MEVVGYVTIKKDATTGTSAVPMERFLGKDCRVFEFASDGGVFVIDAQATGIAMFDACDIYRSFKCNEYNGVLCPPGGTPLANMAYSMKAISRKGGYPPTVKFMVIEASLQKGEFNDNFLWQVNPEDNPKPFVDVYNKSFK